MNLIILGHGNYATGLYSSLVMITGPKENVEALDFLENESDTLFGQKLNKLVKNKKEVLFVCDLMGGTPYKEAAKLAFHSESMEVVCGANLGGLVDTSLKLDSLSLKEAVTNLVNSSTKNIIVLEKKPLIKETHDGI